MRHFSPSLFALALMLFMPAPAVAQPVRSAGDEVLVAAPSYPKILTTEQGVVTIHHPQIETWDRFEVLSGWVPIEARLKDSEINWISSVKFEGQTDIDFVARLVVLHDIKIVEHKNAGQEPPEVVANMVHEAISLQPRSIILDVLLRALPEDFEVTGKALPEPELKFDPPKIFISTTPAALMIIDGEPVKVPIDDTRLEFVVNTNWDLFWDTKKARWYVLNDGAWQRSDILLGTEWETTKRLPGDFKKIPKTKNWEAVHEALPAKKPEVDPPKILISQEPAELILIDGTPKLEPIADTGIRYVSNTDGDLFAYSDRYYYLVSGRWFSTYLLEGEWDPVPIVDLPEPFKRIPSDHAKSSVLVSVPGTVDARVARIEAQIPRTAEIDSTAGQDLEVYYAGDPEFVAIEGTTLKRAVNTSNQVIAYNGYYYLCYNAVWFFSTKPDGPWSPASKIPDEIYKIPASDPAHNVTYVYVYEQPASSTVSSTQVTFAYTSGYYGVYPYTTVVYGTGWYYPPYVYYPSYGYPYYWHYPTSYGYGAWYNPATGVYGQRAVAYGPYGGAAATSVYNPKTGAYARGRSVWDNDELARQGYGYNPSTQTRAAGNMYYDFDDNEGWREGVISRGDRWVYGETEFDGNTATTDFVTSRGIEGTSQREWDDGEMTGSGTLEGNNRSAKTQASITDDGASLNVQGSEGGSINISQDRGETGREISGETAGGTRFTGESERTGQGGRQTNLEGEAGGQATINRQGGDITGVAKSAEGDLYAGRNGNVFKKTDDGWSSYDNGSWNSTNRSSSQSSFERSDSQLQSRSNQFSWDTNNLDRQYNARQNGTRNYNQYRSQSSSLQRSRGGRRRR